MKKLIMAVLMLGVCSLPISASAGSVWGLIKNSGMTNIPSNEYTISVKGVDIRAYVFEIKEMNSVCVSVWGDHTSQLECKTYDEINNTRTKGDK